MGRRASVPCLVVVVLVLCGMGLARAEELDPLPARGARIAAVVVEGAPDEAAAEGARALFGVQAGDAFDLVDVRLGIKRVFLTGPFADVRVFAEPGEHGLTLFLRLVPDRVVREVVLDVGGGLAEEPLRRAVGIDAGDRFREERLPAAVAALSATLHDLGYPRAKVDVEVLEAGAAGRRLVFRVDPGEPVLVSSLRIRGAPRLSRREIEELLGVDPGQPFDRARLERGLEKLRELLVRRRHLGARAEIDSIAYGDDERAVEVVVLVEAGPAYAVRFVGNEQVPDAYLGVVVPARKIGSLEKPALQRAKTALEEDYRRQGFHRARVDVVDMPASPPLDEIADRELRFVVEEGPRAEIHDVVVVGAEHKDAAALAEEVRRFLVDEAPDLGPLERVAPDDLGALLSSARAPVGDDEEPDEREPPSKLAPPVFRSRMTYRHDKLVAAGQRLVDLYRNDGFLDAVVEGPLTEMLDDGRTARVRFRVVEGARVLISGVRFVVPSTRCEAPGAPAACGETAVPEPDLLAALELAPGQPANMGAITEARTVLEKSLAERGHPFARVTESVERAHGADVADVVFHVAAGPKVRVGELRVQGNDVTVEAVILDRLKLKRGGLYQASAVEESRQRLLRLGIFSSVSIDLLDDKADATVRDVLIRVRERPQYAVEVGAGMSVEDGPRAFVAGEVRNILGFGFGLKTRAQLNYPRVFYELIYDEGDPDNPENRIQPLGDPRIDWAAFFEGEAIAVAEIPKLYGMPFDTRVHVDTIALREIRPAFTLNRGSVLLGTEVQGVPWLHVGPQVEIEASDFDCSKDVGIGQSCGEGSLGLTRRRDAGFLRQGTLRLVSSVDLRDNPVRPHAGAFTSATAELAVGSGELRTNEGPQDARKVNSDFVKLHGLVSGYVPLAPRFTWALTLRAGNIFPITSGSYIPLFKRFYLGGTNSVRGFREDEVLPADHPEWPASRRFPLVLDDDETTAQRPPSLGGSFFLNGRSELRIAVVGDVEAGFFVDAGQLLEDVSRFQAAGFTVGAGFGVRYATPVGPFVVDLGWKVVDGQRALPPLLDLQRMNLHFSIGYF